MEEGRNIFVDEVISHIEEGTQEDYFDQYTNEELEDLLKWLQQVEQEENQENQRGGAMERTGNGFQFTLEKTRERKNRRFNVNEQDYYLSIQQEDREARGDVIQAFQTGLARSLDNITRGMASTDRIRFFMSSDKIRNAVNLPLMEVGALGDGNSAANRILGIVESILNSNESFDVNDSLRINRPARENAPGSWENSQSKSGIRVGEVFEEQEVYDSHPRRRRNLLCPRHRHGQSPSRQQPTLSVYS